MDNNKSKVSKKRASNANTQKKIVLEIKKALKPLYRNDVSFVYVYGSFKTGKYNDIDILVVADNFTITEKGIKELTQIITALQAVYQKKYKLHIQPLKFFKPWWKAIIQGEPWILTSITNSIPLYDRDKILPQIKRLIDNEKTYNAIIKHSELEQSSREYDVMNRIILLQSLESLALILQEAIQIFFLSKGKILLDKEEIYNELQKTELKEFADDYKEIIDLESKYHRGYLNEFTAENLDYYTEKIQGIWKVLEKTL